MNARCSVIYEVSSFCVVTRVLVYHHLCSHPGSGYHHFCVVTRILIYHHFRVATRLWSTIISVWSLGPWLSITSVKCWITGISEMSDVSNHEKIP